MNLRRRGSAALLAAVTVAPAAFAVPDETGPPRRGEAPAPSETESARRVRLFESLREASREVAAIAQTGSTRQGPVFARPGDWAHAEAAVVIGSQLVDQDLGFSRNIFQTVSAEAEDVGFGQHFGARGSFFVNRYLGAEAGFARTRTEFEFAVADEEAGVTIFEDALVQVSQEASIAAVVQWPRAAITPYGVAGYAWRSSEIEAAEPFESGAIVFGVGIKVPFPGYPVSLAFDYRFIEYRDEEEGALRLAEGGMSAPTVSALTVGVVVRLNVNR